MTEDKNTRKSKMIKTVIYLLVVCSIVFALYMGSVNPQPRPNIPADKDHQDLEQWENCLDCHSADGEYPTKPTHPINREKCLRCHVPEDNSKKINDSKK